MAALLRLEAEHKAKAELLFVGHRFLDISASAEERKSGTDFLVELLDEYRKHGRLIRCENKFEQWLTRRLTLEWISVDRPYIKPGWFVTSRAAWLFSWFPSQELIALPMDEVRRLVGPNPARHRATTARNRKYLTWSTLESVDYLLSNIENARVLDITRELNIPRTGERMVRGALLKKKQCEIEELVALMKQLPAESTPLTVSESELIDIARDLAPLNFKRFAHKAELERLAWLKQPLPRAA